MHLSSISEAEFLKEVESSPVGLSHEEARHRLARDGPNRLQASTPVPVFRLLLKQFSHFLAGLLWVAAGLAFVAESLNPGEGMAVLGWAIVGVIIINALFTFAQEYKAERAVQALHQLLPSSTWVLRGGHTHQIPREAVVCGDLLVLEEGEQIPADARLIDAVGLRMDLASLTGESRPKRRTTDIAPHTNLADAPNLVLAGTTVLSGRGRAVVYATGMRTEFGKIARLATSADAGPTPLQREIIHVTHVVALLSLGMGALFFLIGLSAGLGFWISAIFGIGIIVANVPEGLLPTVTLALAMGSQRMAKRKALIKHLTSVETLGCTTVICTDKTGTLTENRMRVEQLFVDGAVVDVREGALMRHGRGIHAETLTQWQRFFQALALCNNARRVRRHGGQALWQGDPTEVALAEFVQGFRIPDGERFPRMNEIPFDADRKRMSTIHWIEGKLVALVKGAPEFLIPLCDEVMERGTSRPMASGEREQFLFQSRTFAQQAYRVLAVATRHIPHGAETLSPETVEHSLTFLGLVAMIDPPHREVPEAVARCRKAGVRVMMITGDHPLTALAIGRKIGLAPEGDGEQPDAFVPVVDGERLDAMDDDALRRLLTPKTREEAEPIFARMAPRQKMRIVSCLKEMGEVVAVTGDGVNDAPALRKADIGIAMGVAGTDVAKETADMVLLDDNFATIVNAIEEGRTVYANIRKFVTYVLSSNVPEIIPYLGYGLFHAPLALTVPLILAVDLGTDMVPALSSSSRTSCASRRTTAFRRHGDASAAENGPAPQSHATSQSLCLPGPDRSGDCHGRLLLVPLGPRLDVGHAVELDRSALSPGDGRHLCRDRHGPSRQRLYLPG